MLDIRVFASGWNAALDKQSSCPFADPDDKKIYGRHCFALFKKTGEMKGMSEYPLAEDHLNRAMR